MLRRRILERGKQDEIYPVLMVGPNSFTLDGQLYTGKPQVAGKRFSDGERAYVGFAAVGRRQPVILAGATRQGTQRGAFHSIAVAVGYWYQSNFSAGQNAVGGEVNPNLLDATNSTTNWQLPTSTETGVEHVGLRALGLALISAPLRNWTTGDLSGGSPVDVYATCWPQENASVETALCLGAWRVSDRVNLWTAKTSFSADAWTNPDYPLHARFFADQLTGWLHGTATPTNTSPGTIFSAAASGLSFSSNISRASGAGLNLANISHHSFVVTVESVDTIESYFLCPAHPATTGTGQATVDFLKMAQATGEWTSHSSYDVGEIPEPGPTEIPDLLEYGNEAAGPNPWWNSEGVVFASGGVLDLFDSTRWTKGHWTVRTLLVNGTAGTLVDSKDFTPVSNPEVLTNASLKTPVLAGDYPPTDIADTYWRGGIELGEETNSEWAYYPEMAPILLPAAEPFTQRIQDFTSALAFSGAARLWPTDLKNLGGGLSVDSAGTIWFCVLEPKQFAYGGEVTERDTGEVQDTYRWLYEDNNQCEGYNQNNEGVVTTPDHPTPGYPEPPVPGGDTVFLVEECSPGSGTTRSRSWRIDQITSRPLYINVWNQKPGWTWVTKLYGLKSDTTLLKADISQLKALSHLATVVGNSVGTTELNFPICDNVWRSPMSFPDQEIVAILRDLHADALGKNPSPAIEIRNVASSFAVLSTIRLGSYTELKASDAGDLSWRAGDQEWNPYAWGAPRMKGCLDAEGNPMILAMVGETKKVDVATESQFKRVCYALIELGTPSIPTVTRVALTSPDEGVGSSGDVPTDWPLWWEWDTLILTPGHVAWIKDSKFRESEA